MSRDCRAREFANFSVPRPRNEVGFDDREMSATLRPISTRPDGCLESGHLSAPKMVRKQGPGPRIATTKDVSRLFSVVIPLFNKAHTIVGTVASVLAQDFEDFEIIIINDGSTDGGPEMVRTTFHDSRIRIVDQENQGVSVARNHGVAIAERELVAFLDGDDILLPGYLSSMHAVAEEFPDAGMICCAGVMVYPDGSGYKRYSARYGSRNQIVDYFINPWFFNNSSSTVVRRSVFNLGGGFPRGMPHWEDHAFFQTLALHVSVAYCPVPLSVIRRGVGGHASSDLASSLEDYARKTDIVYSAWTALEANRRSSMVPEFLVRDVRIQLLHLLRNRDYDKLDLLIERTAPVLGRHLERRERRLYSDHRLRPIAVAWLYATKIADRARCYPRARYARRLEPVGTSLINATNRPLGDR